MSIKRPCNHPGCPELVRSGYCDGHRRATQHRYDRARGTARQRRYDAVWDEVSRQYRRAHPLCEDCEDEGRTTPVSLVHHMVPLGEGGARLDKSNLRSLCSQCHQRTHAA